MSSGVSRRTLPGFGIGLGYAITYLSLLVLIPLIACVVKAASLGRRSSSPPSGRRGHGPRMPSRSGPRSWRPRSMSSSAHIVAWTFVRYEFPGKRLVDALVDVPLALPTAVAGLVYASLYVPNGWIGQFLTPLGIQAAYSRLGIVLVLVFTGFPFVVRTMQPVLADLDAEVEEAASVLGRLAVAIVPPRDFADPGSACSDRICTGIRPRTGRIRLGHLHLQQQDVRDRDRARC